MTTRHIAYSTITQNPLILCVTGEQALEKAKSMMENSSDFIEIIEFQDDALAARLMENDTPCFRASESGRTVFRGAGYDHIDPVNELFADN